jgi:hypothetical protein
MTDDNPFHDLLRLSAYLNGEEVQMKRVVGKPEKRWHQPFVDFNHPMTTNHEDEASSNGAATETLYQVYPYFGMDSIRNTTHSARFTLLISGDRHTDEQLLPFYVPPSTPQEGPALIVLITLCFSILRVRWSVMPALPILPFTPVSLGPMNPPTYVHLSLASGVT